MENLFAKIKICHSKRLFGKLNQEKYNINLDDLNNGLEKYKEFYYKDDDNKNKYFPSHFYV